MTEQISIPQPTVKAHGHYIERFRSRWRACFTPNAPLLFRLREISPKSLQSEFSATFGTRAQQTILDEMALLPRGFYNLNRSPDISLTDTGPEYAAQLCAYAFYAHGHSNRFLYRLTDHWQAYLGSLVGDAVDLTAWRASWPSRQHLCLFFPQKVAFSNAQKRLLNARQLTTMPSFIQDSVTIEAQKHDFQPDTVAMIIVDAVDNNDAIQRAIATIYHRLAIYNITKIRRVPLDPFEDFHDQAFVLQEGNQAVCFAWKQKRLSIQRVHLGDVGLMPQVRRLYDVSPAFRAVANGYEDCFRHVRANDMTSIFMALATGLDSLFKPAIECIFGPQTSPRNRQKSIYFSTRIAELGSKLLALDSFRDVFSGLFSQAVNLRRDQGELLRMKDIKGPTVESVFHQLHEHLGNDIYQIEFQILLSSKNDAAPWSVPESHPDAILL